MIVATILMGAFLAGLDRGEYILLLPLILIGLLTHGLMGIFNELLQRGEDAEDKTGQHPMTKISKGDWELYFEIAFSSVPIPFVISWACFGGVSTMILAIAGALALYYNWRGKYQFIIYDLFPAVGLGLLVIYGSVAISGTVNVAVLLVALGTVIVEIMLQWAGGMKDVRIDEKYGVGSTAVYWGYKGKGPVGLNTGHGTYFSMLTIELSVILFLPLVFIDFNTPYLLFWICYVLSTLIIGLVLVHIYNFNYIKWKAFLFWFFSSLSLFPLAFMMFYYGWEGPAIIAGFGVGWVILMRLLKVKY